MIPRPSDPGGSKKPREKRLHGPFPGWLAYNRFSAIRGRRSQGRYGFQARYWPHLPLDRGWRRFTPVPDAAIGALVVSGITARGWFCTLNSPGQGSPRKPQDLAREEGSPRRRRCRSDAKMERRSVSAASNGAFWALCAFRFLDKRLTQPPLQLGVQIPG